MTDEWCAVSGTNISPNEQGLGRFSVTRGGSCTAAGVGSSIVGLRSDLNILDDPVRSFEESMSSTQLGKTWDWYQTEFRTRLVPTGREVVVTTRWAKNDPAGRILQLVAAGDEDWEVIRLPMLADAPDDPLGRALNEPLWPEWFGNHQIEENQRDPLRWSAMYQQTPLDDSGSWVPLDNVHIVDDVPERMNYVMAIDLALTVGAGDYTAIAVAGIDEDRCINVVDVFRQRISPDQTAEELFEFFFRYQPRDVFIDDDPAAKVFIKLLFEMARSRGIPIPIRPLPLRGRDKETRAAAIRGYFLQGRVKIKKAPWNTDLIREISEFPSGDHDDQIDALGLIGRELARTGSPISEVRRPPKPEEYAVVIGDDGKHYTRATMDEMFEDHERKSSRNRRRI